MLVLGIKKVNFQADDGRTIDDITLYGSYDADGVDGVATDKAFVSSDKFNGVEVKVGDEFENYLDLFDIPIIAVGNNLSFLPYVGIDDFSAMGEITAKTIEEGYENIIYFSPALKYSDAYAQRCRYEGFLNAIGSRRYRVITDIDEIKSAYDEKTAIICSSDYYALKVYFKGCGAKIIGFDNIRALDNYNIPIDSVGYSTGEIAKEVIASIKENKTSDILIKHKIVARK